MLPYPRANLSNGGESGDSPYQRYGGGGSIIQAVGKGGRVEPGPSRASRMQVLYLSETVVLLKPRTKAGEEVAFSPAFALLEWEELTLYS